jgi:hypothetical protein
MNRRSLLDFRSAKHQFRQLKSGFWVQTKIVNLGGMLVGFRVSEIIGQIFFRHVPKAACSGSLYGFFQTPLLSAQSLQEKQ